MAKQSCGITQFKNEQATVRGNATRPARKSLAARLHKQMFDCVRSGILRFTNTRTVKFAVKINRAKTTRLAQIKIDVIGNGVVVQTCMVSFVALVVSSITKLEFLKRFRTVEVSRTQVCLSVPLLSRFC